MPATLTLNRTTGAPRNVLFNAGEGLVHDDLNWAEDLTELRSLVWPNFTRIALGTYGAVTDAGAQDLLKIQTDNLQRTFTYGGGAIFETSGTQISRIRGGILVAYDSSSRPMALVASLNARSAYLRQFYVGETDDAGEKVEFTHTLNATGADRIDMVTVKFTEIADQALSRDFKDAVTGAITSVSTNKRSGLQATFSMYEGIDPNTPGALPSDEHLLYTVTMPSANGAIADLRDWTYPLGRKSIQVSPPAVMSTGAWTISGSQVQTGSGGDIQDFWPPHAGDPVSRLLGIRLQYQLGPGAAVTLCQRSLTAGGGVVTTRKSITSSLTLDNTVRGAFIDVSGDLRVDSALQTDNPIWMSGELRRRASVPLDGSANPLSIALRVTSGTGTNAIFAIQWAIGEGG